MLYPEILVVRAWMASAVTRVKTGRDERGAVETGTVVVLGAIFAAGAIVIGGIIIAKFKGGAEAIPTP